RRPVHSTAASKGGGKRMGVLQRFSLEGRIALVTAGAGPLFGSSISEALAQAGATVVTASRSLERNQEFAEKLRSQGWKAEGMAVDVSNPDSIRSLRDELIGRFGSIDVLVNSALAREGHRGRFEEQTPDDWRKSAEGD